MSFKSSKICVYGLGACHYFSSSRLSWDAWRTMTGVKLDFVTVVHMNHFIKKGMRGGVCYIVKQTIKLVSLYDKPPKYIVFKTVDNFYRYAM